MTDKSLYYIAIIPPDPVYSFADEKKQYFAKSYNAKASLKSPPHITLHMPFRLKEKRAKELLSSLSHISKERKLFELQIDGYGHFNERVIYLKVDKPDGLEELFYEVRKTMKVNFNQFNADYKNRGYNPHLTLAFRDLKKEEFKKVWPIIKDEKVQFEFTVNSFSLLKHNGKSWDVFRTFEF